jgi:hypothetical protein
MHDGSAGRTMSSHRLCHLQCLGLHCFLQGQAKHPSIPVVLILFMRCCHIIREHFGPFLGIPVSTTHQLQGHFRPTLKLQAEAQETHQMS